MVNIIVFNICLVTRRMIDLQAKKFMINVEVIENQASTMRRANRNLKKQKIMKSQIFVIPKIKLSFIHYRTESSKEDGSYCHHHVYVKPFTGKLRLI